MRMTRRITLVHVREFSRQAVIVIISFLLLIALFMATIGNLEHKSYAMAFLSSCVLLVLTRIVFRTKGFEKIIKWINRSNPIYICLILSTLCLFVNGIFAFYFRPVQAADYRTFYQVAKDLASGSHPGMKDYVAMFPHILGYSSVLSVFFRLFGQQLSVAVGLNVLLTVLSGILLFYLTLEMTDSFSATMIYLLWTICPSKMFYNTMSLSEPTYTFFILLFFWLTKQFELSIHRRVRPTIVTLYASLAGIILAAVQATRPIGIIPILSLGLWLLFLSGQTVERKQLKVWSGFFLVLISSFYIGNMVWCDYATKQLEQTPPSVPGYSIYVGFNLETNGSYSDTDMDLLQSRYFGEYNRNAEATQRSMFEDAKIRIINAKPFLSRLLPTKLCTLLGHDEGGVYYARESLSAKQYALGCVISNLWYYYTCLISIVGLIHIKKKQECGLIIIAIIFAIGLITAQLLVEVAARYHYVLISVLLLIGGYAFSSHNSQKIIYDGVK